MDPSNNEPVRVRLSCGTTLRIYPPTYKIYTVVASDAAYGFARVAHERAALSSQGFENAAEIQILPQALPRLKQIIDALVEREELQRKVLNTL